LQSYGATYVAQNFIDAKSFSRTQFLQVISRRITESLETEMHMDCTCHISGGISPFSECRVTSRKEREPLAVSIFHFLFVSFQCFDSCNQSAGVLWSLCHTWCVYSCLLGVSFRVSNCVWQILKYLTYMYSRSQSVSFQYRFIV